MTSAFSKLSATASASPSIGAYLDSVGSEPASSEIYILLKVLNICYLNISGSHCQYANYGMSNRGV